MTYIFIISIVVILLINRIAGMVPFILTTSVTFYFVITLNILFILFMIIFGIPGLPPLKTLRILTTTLLILLIFYHFIPLFSKRSLFVKEKRRKETEKRGRKRPDVRIIDS